MNDDKTHFDSPHQEPGLEARVVAWVLGEASPFEAAELERRCATEPELAVFKRRIEAVHGLLGEVARPAGTGAVWRLAPERRAGLLAKLREGADADGIAGADEAGGAPGGNGQVTALPVEASRARTWSSWVMPLAACLALGGLLAAIILPTVGKVRGGGDRPVQASARALADVLEPMEQAEGRASLQILRRDSRVVQSESVADSVASADLRYERVEPLAGAELNLPRLAASATASAPAAASVPAAPPAPVVAPAPAQMPAERAKESSAATWFGTRRGSSDGGAGPAPQKLEAEGRLQAGQEGTRFAAANGFAGGATTEVLAGEVRSRRAARQLAADQRPALSEEMDTNLFAKADREGQVVLGRSLTTTDAKQEQTKAGVEDLGTRKDVGFAITANAGVAVDSFGYGLSLENGVAAAPVPTADDSVRERLMKIVIPEISLRDVPLSRALASLSAHGSEYDGSGSEDGVAVVFNGTAGADPKLTIRLRNMSLRRVLDILTEEAGYGYEVRGGEVVVEKQTETSAEEAAALSRKADIDDALRAEVATGDEAVSTFSLHVGDVSFQLAKAALERGEAPDPASIRPEEFYNAFDYGDPAPAAGEPVACRVEQAAHPFLQQRNLVRIALRVPAAGRGAGTPLNLTVLLDTSGSMEREDRAATVRAALSALSALLGVQDRVTLIGFARQPRLLAENLPGDQAGTLTELAERTPAEGGTNLEEALRLAEELAQRHGRADAQSRIVLLTDGAANLGDADPARLAAQVEALRRQGVAFDACGVCADGLDDGMLEALTRKGDGRYLVLNSPEEADAGFARKLAGALRPAAENVKVQVRFNPARVARYRLIGFEQHRLREEDFKDDKVDAAELAAEEAAVALYQVEPLPGADLGELGEVAVRFRDPAKGEMMERSWTLAHEEQPPAFDRAPAPLRLAGAAALLAEKLRGGAPAGMIRLDELAPVVAGLRGAYAGDARVEDFIRMFDQTRRLTGE